MVGTKTNIKRAVARIVLIEAENLPMEESKQLSVYCSLRLGNKKELTKTVTTDDKNPIWREIFQFNLYEESDDPLFVKIKRHKPLRKKDLLLDNEEIGNVTIDLSGLKQETTIDLWKNVDGNPDAKIHLLITISGVVPTVEDYDMSYKSKELLDASLANHISPLSFWFKHECTGKLLIMVHRAEGLASLEGITTSWKSNPFCELKLGYDVRRTQTVYKKVPSLWTVWNKHFEFEVRDVLDCLDISVFDEENEKKHRLIGRLKIPLLKITNKEKTWFGLKDNSLRIPAKGDNPRILLEFFFFYNPSMLQCWYPALYK